MGHISTESAGSSATARAFGAQVNISAPDTGMALVCGAAVSPVPAIVAAGGRPLLVFPGTHKALAVIPHHGLALLRGRPDITMAGPVQIDPARFARFAGLISGTNGNGTNGNGTNGAHGG